MQKNETVYRHITEVHSVDTFSALLPAHQVAGNDSLPRYTVVGPKCSRGVVLNIVFVDQEEAFDRDKLWQTLEMYNV